MLFPHLWRFGFREKSVGTAWTSEVWPAGAGFYKLPIPLLTHYFCCVIHSYSQPCIEFNSLSCHLSFIFIHHFSLASPVNAKLSTALEALQLCLKLLPCTCRDELRKLLSFMAVAAKPQAIQLEKEVSARKASYCFISLLCSSTEKRLITKRTCRTVLLVFFFL